MKARAWWFVKLGVTGAVLWLLLARVPFSQVISTLAGVKGWYLLAGLLAVGVSRYVAARRMKILTDHQGLALTTRQLLEIGCVSSLYSLALPGSLTGGAIRWHRVSRAARKPAEGLVAIGLDRLLDTAALAWFGLAFWALDPLAGANRAAGLTLLALSGLLGLACVLACTRLARVQTLSARAHVRLFILSFARHLLGLIGSYALALAVGMHTGPVSLGWVVALMLMMGMLPISVAGFGVREASAVLLLAPYGVPPAEAMAWSLLLFGTGLASALIGGLVEVRDLLQSQRMPARTEG